MEDNLFVQIIISIITGIISGVLVDYWARKREKKREIYQFWHKFLLDQLKNFDIYIEAEVFSNIPKFKNGNTQFRDNIFEILDNIYPQNSEDREYSDEENQYFEKILETLKELEKWKKENKFIFNRKKVKR